MKANLKKVLKGHASGIYTAYFDEENGILYSGSGDGMLAAWDIEKLEPHPFSVKVGIPVYSVAIQKGKNHLLVGQSEGGIHIIDRKNKTELRHLKYHSRPIFQMLEDSKRGFIYSAGGDGLLSIIDANSYKLLWSVPVSEDKLRCLLPLAKGAILAVGGSDGYIRFFETEYFNEISHILAHEGGVYDMLILSDGQIISSGRDGHIRIWTIENNENLHLKSAIPAHNYAIYALTLHGAGNHFASASRDKTVKIWDRKDLLHPLRIQRKGPVGHTHSVNVCGWIPNKDLLYSAGDDRDIYLWEVEGLN